MGLILKKIVAKNKWIIECAWSDRATDSFKKADLVIILNPSYFSLIYNHLKRIIVRQKKFTLSFNLKLLRKSIKYSIITKSPSLYSHTQEARKNKNRYILIKNKKDLKNLLNRLKS
jgi:FMN-dependent NADH-azoreductase